MCRAYLERNTQKQKRRSRRREEGKKRTEGNERDRCSLSLTIYHTAAAAVPHKTELLRLYIYIIQFNTYTDRIETLDEFYVPTGDTPGAVSAALSSVRDR